MAPELLWAMISRAIDLQFISLAFLLACGYYGLLRTGELLQMKYKHITPPAHELLIHLPDSKTATKGGPGETVVIRDQRVCHLFFSLRKLSSGHGAIWPYAAQTFREQLLLWSSFSILMHMVTDHTASVEEAQQHCTELSHRWI